MCRLQLKSESRRHAVAGSFDSSEEESGNDHDFPERVEARDVVEFAPFAFCDFISRASDSHRWVAIEAFQMGDQHTRDLETGKVEFLTLVGCRQRVHRVEVMAVAELGGKKDDVSLLRRRYAAELFGRLRVLAKEFGADVVLDHIAEVPGTCAERIFQGVEDFREGFQVVRSEKFRSHYGEPIFRPRWKGEFRQLASGEIFGVFVGEVRYGAREQFQLIERRFRFVLLGIAELLRMHRLLRNRFFSQTLFYILEHYPHLPDGFGTLLYVE
jgi:hypothetical protein